MNLRITVLIVVGALAAYGQPLKTTDISPDGTNYTWGGMGSRVPGSGGRIMSLVIDPNHDGTLYAAGEFGGVWKTTTGIGQHSGTLDNMTWAPATNGLRNGLTQNAYSLAVDQFNSDRLLYATGDDDGRPVNASGYHRFGGLWVSLDAADTWRHVHLCRYSDDGITSVAFSTGQPFVATNCGIWTAKGGDLDEASSWSLLSGTPEGITPGAFLVDGGYRTVFACNGFQVYRTNDLGASWDTKTLNGFCSGLTAVPHPGSSAYQVVVVRSKGASQEVTIVDFNAHTMSDLGFDSVAVSGGSGDSVVATAQIASIPLLIPLLGVNYDLYAADGLTWYEYGVTAPHWRKIDLHVDTWGMVFPSWYDPTKGLCAAYAANDGGVYFNAFNLGIPGLPFAGGGCAGGPWLPVMNGLHALEATVVTAITAKSAQYANSALPLALYLPTGDNDTFASSVGLCVPGTAIPELCIPEPVILWQSLPDGLGDAGQALVDPAFPEQVLLARNKAYHALYNPPFSGGTFSWMVDTYASPTIPLLPLGADFDPGYQGAGSGGLLAVMTTPSELSTPVTHSDYIALEDFDPSKCDPSQVEWVVRNTTLDPTKWEDMSPNDHFLPCDIEKMQAGGGHSSGSLNVYVLTTLNSNPNKPAASFNNGRKIGQIYRGVVSDNNQIPGWASASGSPDNPFNQLGQADNFYVNPFDPAELWAVDVAGGFVEVSRDSGNTWTPDFLLAGNPYPNFALSNIATNRGEYVMGCNGSRGAGGAKYGQSDPFANGCSVAWMAFDVFHPKIRVAGAGYGGIAFSRDNGHHWIPLDVTNNNHKLSNRLTKRVSGVYFDAETSIPGVDPSNQVIYAGLKGQSLIRVEGPFLTLEALGFSYTTEASPSSVEVDVGTTGQKVELRKDPDGVYRGQVLFDSNLYTALNYSLIVDGTTISSHSYTLTESDIDHGVAVAPPL